ncbi:TlpA family protein disulfide reductase [Prolixibacteraceae bacterium JC049]|nr:TlpA family protein disulfide reductase [Prolixibacteraceae bacterium JC049]
MKIYWLALACVVSFVKCGDNPEKTIQSTLEKISNEQQLAYNVKELTIQGSKTGDTIFTTQRCEFKKNIGDENFGYQFIVEDSLLHPHFRIPIISHVEFNGIERLWMLESKVKNMNKKDLVSESTLKKLKNDISGQLPVWKELLSKKGFKHTIVKDSAWGNKVCTYINALSADSAVHEMFVDKATNWPALFRVIINEKQPFIKEYHIGTQKSKQTFLISKGKEPVPTKETIERVKVGDLFPVWNLEDTNGKAVQFKDRKAKYTVLFLSGINCGYCQKALPVVKQMHQKCKSNTDVDCLAFYADDSKAKLLSYMKEKGIDYPIVFNPEKNAEKRYKQRQRIRFGLPTTFILNGENKIVWIKNGYSKELGNAIRSKLKELGY